MYAPGKYKGGLYFVCFLNYYPPVYSLMVRFSVVIPKRTTRKLSKLSGHVSTQLVSVFGFIISISCLGGHLMKPVEVVLITFYLGGKNKSRNLG